MNAPVSALPQPGYPMVTRVVSDCLFPTPRQKEEHRNINCPHCQVVLKVPVKIEESSPEPMTWVVSQTHPLVPGMRVVRMFVVDGGVEVYSSDSRNYLRNIIPMGSIKLVEEAMPVEMFEDEITRAEADLAEEDSEDEDAELDEELSDAPSVAAQSHVVPPVANGSGG
jgi:hypothetical protein